MSTMKRNELVSAAEHILRLAQQVPAPGEAPSPQRMDAARRIAQLTDHEWRVLSRMRRRHVAALAAHDDETAEFTLDSIAGILFPPPAEERASLERMPEAALTPAHAPASAPERHESRQPTFIENYLRCKAASGLETYRQIAAKAGVSVTTVQAIEQLRVKPHFRTIRRLARAFGVEVEDLLGPATEQA